MHRLPLHDPRIARLTLRLALGLALCLPAGQGAAQPARQAALLAEHAAVQARLLDSPFGEPLLLRTTQADGALQTGDMLALQLQPQADAAGHFSLLLTAPTGPLGSSDLRVHLEAVSLVPDQTDLHITYHQATGLAARLATQLYLATAGRDKLGFSRGAPGPDGQMRLIGGERAALERNVMRHDLALLASSAAADGTPAAQRDTRRRAWFALTERHATQLHEIDLAGYLAEKAGAGGAAR